MLFFLIGTPIILGVFIGFTDFSEGAFFRGLGGEIVQGVLSIACFTLVGAAFWRFGWKIGLPDFLLLFIASNVGLTLHRAYGQQGEVHFVRRQDGHPHGQSRPSDWHNAETHTVENVGKTEEHALDIELKK